MLFRTFDCVPFQLQPEFVNAVQAVDDYELQGDYDQEEDPLTKAQPAPNVVAPIIGQLVSEYPKPKPESPPPVGFGSGVLIQCNNKLLILTCAHAVCKYSPLKSTLQNAVSVVFYPGKSRSKAAAVTCNVTRCHIHPNYSPELPFSEFDVAVLEFKSSDMLPKANITWGKWDPPQNHSIFKVSGYPADKNIRGNSLTLAGEINTLNGLLLSPSMKTVRGQSGSPLLKYNFKIETWVIIGVLLGYSTSDACSVYSPISTDLYQWIGEVFKVLS